MSTHQIVPFQMVVKEIDVRQPAVHRHDEPVLKPVLYYHRVDRDLAPGTERWAVQIEKVWAQVRDVGVSENGNPGKLLLYDG